jgi:hypothetical protein
MSEKDKITWIVCPDCGSKIGIVVSVGKTQAIVEDVSHESSIVYQKSGIQKKLEEAGLDLELVEIEEGETSIIISPKKFLGDFWGPVNDIIKNVGGFWIRDGRNSRWEINIEYEDV